jgi:hypothetical protein
MRMRALPLLIAALVLCRFTATVDAASVEGLLSDLNKLPPQER